MATVVSSVQQLNNAMKLTQDTASQFKSLGGQVQSAMAELASQYVSTSGTDFQNALIQWQDQLTQGINAFNEMADAISKAIQKFQANEHSNADRVRAVQHQLGGGKDFGSALNVGR